MINEEQRPPSAPQEGQSMKPKKITCQLTQHSNGKVECVRHHCFIFYIYYINNTRPRCVCLYQAEEFDNESKIQGWYPEP